MKIPLGKLAFVLLTSSSIESSTLDVPRFEVRGSCERCAPELRETGVIGYTGPGAGPVRSIGEDTRGQLYVIHDYSNTSVAVYTPTGKYLRSLGRRGEGPGEYLRITKVHLMDDSIFVYDQRLGKEDVYHKGRVARSRSIKYRYFSALPMPTGDLVINSDHRSLASIAAPFHVLNGTGVVVRSFPNAGGRYRYDEAYLLRRVLAHASDSTFWAAHETQYRISMFSVDGRELVELDRIVPWFLPHQSPSSISPQAQPRPRVRSLHYDKERSMLWVVVWVADTRWREQLTFKDGETLVTGTYPHLFDSIVEAIDIKSKKVVASARYDELIAGFTSNGRLIADGESSSGEPLLRLWSATVAGRVWTNTTRR